MRNKLLSIRADYLSDLNVDRDIDGIIAESGLSRTNFYRMYTKFFHVSPKEDLIWARLEKARDLVRTNPEAKMYEIAAQCGFNDVPHFFRLFKSRYGYTPKDYAKAVIHERD